MLARLDQELKLHRASVNREGALLRIEGPDGADLESRVVAVVESVGYVAVPVAEVPSVPRWFGVDEVDELSQEEAQVLADRWIAELAETRIIDRPDRASDVLRTALLDAFRAAARSGDVGAIEISEAQLRSALDDAEARALRSWIAERLGHVPPEQLDH